jgi:3-deoxy-D-manno-octulosonic-acid transferase
VDRDRFIDLGVQQERVIVTGNTKYDRQPSISQSSQLLQIKSKYFANNLPVMVLGSLRVGEELIWLPALKQATKDGLKVNVVIAPRRPDQFAHFAQALTTAKLPFIARSQGISCDNSNFNILLLDTLGELESVYAIAELSFIGGSITDFGGHNPIEAAAYGSCIAMGKFDRNVTEINRELRLASALLDVNSLAEALEVIKRVAAKDPQLQQIGLRAKEIWSRNLGATEKVIDDLVGNRIL